MAHTEGFEPDGEGRERYLEVRYEDVCKAFEPTADRVLRSIGADDVSGTIERLLESVYRQSVSKHLRQPKDKLREVMISRSLCCSLSGISNLMACWIRSERACGRSRSSTRLTSLSRTHDADPRVSGSSCYHFFQNALASGRADL